MRAAPEVIWPQLLAMAGSATTTVELEETGAAEVRVPVAARKRARVDRAAAGIMARSGDAEFGEGVGRRGEKEDVDDERREVITFSNPLLRDRVLPSAMNGTGLAQSTGADSCPRLGQTAVKRDLLF